MKNNLLNMLSKSEERRRKPRVLPSLEAISPTKSPTKKMLPASPTERTKTQESSLSPSIEARDTTKIMKPELRLPIEEITSEKPVNSSLSPAEEIQPTEHLKHVSTPPPVPSTGQLNMESVVQKQDSLGLYAEPGEDSVTVHEAFQTLEESSSPSETGDRNLVSISVEIEDKENSQLRKMLGSSEESITRSGDSIASHKSLPTSLGHASGPVNALGSLEPEETVVSSLPDLYSQFSEENTNQRYAKTHKEYQRL